jgi:chromosome segregation ATPase
MFASDPSMPRFTRVLVAMTLVVSSAVVHAQADKEGEQLKRLKLQMRQVQQQQQASQEAQAKADQARQQAEQVLKAQGSDLQKERIVAAGASRKAAALSTELEALKAEFARVKAEAAQWQALSAQQKVQLEADKVALEKASATEARSSKERAQLDSQLQQCASHNADLASTGLELLVRYENKGMAEVLAAQEPFVQTGRVKLENLKAAYTRRIQASRLKPMPAPADTSKP